MAEYRKKPIVVEAYRFDPAKFGPDLPDGIKGIPGANADSWDYEDSRFWVHTIEGDMIVNPGDWIITGVEGEIYPCKPSIFEATYEPADAPPPPATDPQPAGVIHEPKEPRPGPTREEFARLVKVFRLASYGDDRLAAVDAAGDALLFAFEVIDKAEAERDAALAALRAQGEIRLDIRHASDLKLRVGVLLQLHWKDLTDEQFDAIHAVCLEALGERP